MATLTHITFTGIDQFTDLDRLWDIHKIYPFAQFGVLTSVSFGRRGFEYPHPRIFKELYYRQVHERIPISLNVCGIMALSLATGRKEDLYEIVGAPYISAFDRLQLNHDSAHELETPCFILENCQIPQPYGEDIVPMFNNVVYSTPCSFYSDSSVLAGKDFIIKAKPWMKDRNVGFSGDISGHNINDVISKLESDPNLDRFWLNIETSLRTHDKFDLCKVERICQMVYDKFEDGKVNRICSLIDDLKQILT